MVGSGSGSSGAAGGGGGSFDPSVLSGLATEDWTDGNYLSKNFFNALFTVHTSIHIVVTDSGGETIDDYTEEGTLAPNQLPGQVVETDSSTGETTTTTTSITSIEAKFGLWTNEFLSALGLSSGGGGGGGSSYLRDLLDVQITNLNEGDVLVYVAGATNKWCNKSGYATQSWVYSNYVQRSSISDMATQTWVGAQGFATENWVQNQRYLTSESYTGTVTSVATGTGLSGGPITTSGTISINSTYQGYISHGETAYGWGNHANAGYATQTWVSNNYLPLTGGTLTGALDLTPSGNEGGEIHLNASSDQSAQAGIVIDQYNSTFRIFGIPSADGHSKTGVGTSLVIDPYAKTITGGYTFDGTASSAGRLSGTGTYNAWGQQFWVNGVPGSISGDMSDVGNITAKNGVASQIIGFTSLELNSLGTLSGYGGFIDFHYNGSLADYTSRIIEDASGRIKVDAQLYIPSANSIRIGDGLLTWDSTNHAIKLIDSNGNAANFYATGGVSALGLSTGGSITNLTVTNNLSIGVSITQPSGSNLFIGAPNGSVCFRDIQSQLNDSSQNEIYWYITQEGVARFNQVWLDGSSYLYVSGGVLYYYDGLYSRSRQIAFIN